MTNEMTTTMLNDDLALTIKLLDMSDDEIRTFVAEYGNDLWITPGDEFVISRGPRSITLIAKSACMRCGGTGIWANRGVCFRCGGASPKTRETNYYKLTKVLVERCQCIKNERAGKGRYTNLELKNQAEANAKRAAREAALIATGIDPKRYWDASQLVGLWGRDTIYVNEEGNQWAREVANPDYNQKRFESLRKLDSIATSIINKDETFALSEKQVALVNEYIEKVENIEQVEADRAAEAKATEVLEGRVVITGTIFWSQEYDGDWGTVTKIGVKADNGAVYFGSRASDISYAEKGDTVTFTATSTKTEPGKGKFSRPAKASIITTAAKAD